MDIPLETAEPCLKISLHFDKVIIVAFVDKLFFSKFRFCYLAAR